MPLHRVRRLFSRAPRHDFSWQASSGGAHGPRAGLPGGGLGDPRHGAGFEVAPTTVLHWLIEAAEQLRAFSASFLCALHLEQLQLDEVYAVLRDCKAGV